MRLKALLFVSVSAAVVVSHAASISHMVVRQQWPWSAKVNIDYVLADTLGQGVDVAVALKTNNVAMTVPVSSFSGDMWDVADGERRIVWDPAASGLPESVVWADVKVELSVATNNYLVIDVSGGANAASWPATLQSKPTGGWTDTHKTTSIVLRRIPAGTATLGSPESEGEIPGVNRIASEALRTVRHTRDFWMAVFPITYAQYGCMTGDVSSVAALGDNAKKLQPLSWAQLRGVDKGQNWPDVKNGSNASAVDEGSLMATLRAKVALSAALESDLVFDLPTEAQWEYACRAGTTTPWNDGSQLDPQPHPTQAGKYTEPNLNRLGWYNYNAGTSKEVGLKIPNAWGLYDMHGLRWEICLDRYYGKSAVLPTGDDPMGLSTWSQARTGRGGGAWASFSDCRASLRGQIDWIPSRNDTQQDYGCRITLHMEQ